MITITITIHEYEPANMRINCRTNQESPTNRETQIAESVAFAIKLAIGDESTKAKETIIVQRDSK